MSGNGLTENDLAERFSNIATMVTVPPFCCGAEAPHPL